MFEPSAEGGALILCITPSERAALQLLAEQEAERDTADQVGVSENGAELTTLFARMGVTSPTEAVAAALRRGLIVAPVSPSVSTADLSASARRS